MDVGSPPPAAKPVEWEQNMADAFDRHVHSPDQSGKLRIDATGFINAFLSKKTAPRKGPENVRPPF